MKVLRDCFSQNDVAKCAELIIKHQSGFRARTEYVGEGGSVWAHNADYEEGSSPKTPKGKEIASKFPDGTPVPESERPPHVSSPDPEASGRPHTVLRKTSDGRIYGAKEFDAEGQPVRDISFTQPTFPNGTPRPNHLPAPTQQPYEPNPTGGTPKRGGEQPLQLPPEPQ